MRGNNLTKISLVIVLSIFFFLFSFSFASAYGFNNPELPKIFQPSPLIEQNITNYITQNIYQINQTLNITNNITVINNITNNITYYQNTSEIDPIFTAENASLWNAANDKYNRSYDALLPWGYNASSPFYTWLTGFHYDYNSSIPFYTFFNGFHYDYNQTNTFNYTAPAIAYTNANACLSNGTNCPSPVTVIYYPESTYTTGGTNDSGNLTLLWYYDLQTYNISEGNGVNSLTTYINFTGIDGNNFTEWITREYYDGSASHRIQFEVYDYPTDTWEQYWEIVGQDGYNVITLSIYDPADHVKSGVAQVRYRHIQNGISSHKLYIDLSELKYTTTSSASSTLLTGYAKYSFDYNNFNGLGNFTGSWLFGNLNWSWIQNPFNYTAPAMTYEYNQSTDYNYYNQSKFEYNMSTAYNYYNQTNTFNYSITDQGYCDARITGNLTFINTNIVNNNTNAKTYADTNINNNVTALKVNGTKTAWSNMTNIPTACTAGQFVTALPTTDSTQLTCSTPSSGSSGNYTEYNVSGAASYVIPTGTTSLDIWCVGAGGGGGGGRQGLPNAARTGGGGGGGGSVTHIVIPSYQLTSPVTITVGAGGTGGLNGSDGGNGGKSSFGTYLSCYGGGGGAGGLAAAVVAGGGGASTSMSATLLTGGFPAATATGGLSIQGTTASTTVSIPGDWGGGTGGFTTVTAYLNASFGGSSMRGCPGGGGGGGLTNAQIPNNGGQGGTIGNYSLGGGGLGTLGVNGTGTNGTDGTKSITLCGAGGGGGGPYNWTASPQVGGWGGKGGNGGFGAGGGGGGAGTNVTVSDKTTGRVTGGTGGSGRIIIIAS